MSWIIFFFSNENIFYCSLFYYKNPTEPYTEYKIFIRAFTYRFDGEASDNVIQMTDISGPSPPQVVNLTCHSQDALYVRWKRPFEYFNTIDFYQIIFKNLENNEQQEITLNASAQHLETAVSSYLICLDFISVIIF